MSIYGRPARPGALPRVAVGITVRVLPKGPARERYRHEFIAELYGMSSLGQLRHATGLLTTALNLWAAVDPRTQPVISELIMPTSPRRDPILCRLNLHHKWERTVNPDGEDYYHCTGCGKDRYDPDRADPTLGGFGGFTGIGGAI